MIKVGERREDSSVGAVGYLWSYCEVTQGFHRTRPRTVWPKLVIAECITGFKVSVTLFRLNVSLESHDV